MSIILDSYNPKAVLLSHTQKSILAAIHNAPTPETAFEAINGTPKLITARNLLERLGLIQVGGNRAVLTDDGRESLISNNITDRAGNLTDDGEAMVNDIAAMHGDVRVTEHFNLLKQLMVS